MSRTRVVGVFHKDHGGVMMRVPVPEPKKAKKLKVVEWSQPEIPAEVDAVSAKNGIPQDIGQWLFIFAFYGRDWLKPSKIGEKDQGYSLAHLGLIRFFESAEVITKWSDGSVFKAAHLCEWAPPELTEKGLRVYIEMQEAIAEGNGP